MTANRGAVMVESAIAIPVILMLIYGSVQLGMVGLEQLTVDGGAFTAAHQQALLGSNLNNYEDAPTLAKETLPHLNSPNISLPEPTFGEPPVTSDTANLSTQYNLGNASARHGGVSMIQPIQTIATAQSTNFATLLWDFGNSISVTGIAIDPAFRLINGHGDVSGNDFNNDAAFATATDPLVNGNNAPPYFIGFNYVEECPYTYAPNAATGWTTCPQQIFAGLGLAEYLDTNNWGRAVNGVVPAPTAVFYEAQLHQNKFADIARDLSGSSQANKINILNPLGGGDVQCVYSFDNTALGTYNAGTTQIGDYPLTPAGDAAVCTMP
jgi:hypothetical protein